MKGAIKSAFNEIKLIAALQSTSALIPNSFKELLG